MWRRQEFLRHNDFGKLRHFSDLLLQLLKIKSQFAEPLPIIGLQRCERLRIDIPDMLAFKDGAIPGVIADRAFIDEPGVELSAIGVQPGLAA